jgi:inner membrane protein
MWGVRDYEHRRAVAALTSRTYESADPLRAAAYPTMIDPFHWFGVVETTNFFVLAPVDSLSPDVDPDGRMEIAYKPEETPITLAAKKSYLGRVYLDWAQYPITETEVLEGPRGGYLVHLQDLRYAQAPGLLDRVLGRPAGPRRILGATVQLDKNLRPIAYIFGPGKKQAADPEP